MHFTKLLLPFVAVVGSVVAQLSVSDFQDALSPAANAINTLNRAIQANPSDTTTVLNDFQQVSVSLDAALNYITSSGGLAGGLSQQDQATIAQIYTSSLTTPLQQTAGLLSRYERTLPAPGQGATYGFITAALIKKLTLLELDLAIPVVDEALTLTAANTAVSVAFAPLALP